MDNIESMDASDIIARVKTDKFADDIEPELPRTARSLAVEDTNAIRNEFILRYYAMGMTTQTIHEMVKAKAKEKGWREASE